MLERIGVELRSWLFGQIISMAIIGLLTWIGLRLLRIPLAEVLGLIAGLLDFLPVVGPWIAGILSVLLALVRSPMHAVYVIALFVGLHFFEGHLLIPLVQRQATRLPPVMTILAMVLFYELFGFMGLLFGNTAPCADYPRHTDALCAKRGGTAGSTDLTWSGRQHLGRRGFDFGALLFRLFD